MKKSFRELLHEKIIILDGATGTNLQKRGLTGGVCPEQWILEHKDAMIDLQTAYVNAGSDILYAPTFSGNSIKFKEYGLQNKVTQMNKALVEVCRESAGNDVLVAGDMTMTGQQLAPLGTLTFDELLSCYEEQAAALDEADVDVFVVETMMSLQETRAAVLAIRKVSKKPIMVTMTFESNGRTLYGTDPVTALVTLQELGIDAFGINCSAGPDTLIGHIQAMKRYAKIPLIAKANAGLPTFVDGETVFPMTPDAFAKASADLVRSGAAIVGGCCGTTPAHIEALAKVVAQMSESQASESQTGDRTKTETYAFASQMNMVPEVTWPVVTTERKVYEFEDGFEGLDLGTHITVSQCPELLDDLKDGMFDTLYDLLDEEADDESDIICVDIDDDTLDACAIAGELISELGTALAPVALSTVNLEFLETYLKLYPGRALIHCKPGSDKDAVAAAASRYGAIVFG